MLKVVAFDGLCVYNVPGPNIGRNKYSAFLILIFLSPLKIVYHIKSIKFVVLHMCNIIHLDIIKDSSDFENLIFYYVFLYI